MSIAYAQKNKNAVQTKRESSVSIIDTSSQSESLQRKADMANAAAQRAEAPRPNNTGMPDNLKAGIESLSGFSMDDVRVHYNSSKPATVQALAYTQGTDIHVAPGQEKHLPHEAWHVAQQMAGRVSPTTNINGMPVNDNAALEHEADVMGEKAVTQRQKENFEIRPTPMMSEIIQCARIKCNSEWVDVATLAQFRTINDQKNYCNLSNFANLDGNIPLPDTVVDLETLFLFLKNYQPPKIFSKKNEFTRINLDDKNLVIGRKDLLLESCNDFINSIKTIEKIPSNGVNIWRLDNQDGGGNFQIQLNYKNDKMEMGLKKGARNGKSTTIACVYVSNRDNMGKVDDFKQALSDSKNDGFVYSDE